MRIRQGGVWRHVGKQGLKEDARDRLIQRLALRQKERRMHKVEPSGVVLHGVCDIQTEHYTAKAGKWAWRDTPVCSWKPALNCPFIF